MTGEKVRELLKDRKIQQKEVAAKLGMSTSNLGNQLDKDDIRTGLLEKISEATGIPIAEFYGVTFGTLETVPDNVTLEYLRVKDDQLTLVMQQVSNAQAQTDKVLAQMDQLISRIPQPAAGALAGRAVQPVIITAPPTGKIVTTTADKLTLAKAGRRAGMVAGIKGKKLTVKPKIG